MNITIATEFNYVIVNSKEEVHNGRNTDDNSKNWTKHPQSYFRYTDKGAALKLSRFPLFFKGCKVKHVEDVKE